MKKTLLVILLISLLLLVTGCKKENLTDNEKFVKEYTSLNNATDSNGKKIVEIATLNKQVTVKYCDQQQIVDAIYNGTHVIYLGWPQCNWCRRMLPVLFDSISEASGISLYYFNIQQYRNSFEENPDSEDGKVYKAVVEALVNSSYDFEELFEKYDDGTFKLASSCVYFIKNGDVIGAHSRTVDSHIDSYEELNNQQYQQLKDIFDQYLKQLTDKSKPACSSSCD